MKADVWQQRSLLELAELDAELSRMAHRIANLPEQKQYDVVLADHRAASDRLGGLALALEDLDTETARFEAEIEGVRQRENRDHKLVDSGTVNSKQVGELQKELETLERRRSSLEDSLLEVMELRERRDEERGAEQATIDALQADLTAAAQTRDDAVADIEQARAQHATRREELVASLDAALLEAYERQRAATGIGAAALARGRCGACRIELDRGELGRITAAPDDEVLRCSECRAILLRVVR